MRKRVWWLRALSWLCWVSILFLIIEWLCLYDIVLFHWLESTLVWCCAILLSCSELRLLTRHNQESSQWSPDPFPRKRVGSGDWRIYIIQNHTCSIFWCDGATGHLVHLSPSCQVTNKLGSHHLSAGVSRALSTSRHERRISSSSVCRLFPSLHLSISSSAKPKPDHPKRSGFCRTFRSPKHAGWGTRSHRYTPSCKTLAFNIPTLSMYVFLYQGQSEHLVGRCTGCQSSPAGYRHWE